MAEVNKIKGYISALSIPNIVYILRKELTPEKTEEIITEGETLLIPIKTIDPSDVNKVKKLTLKILNYSVLIVTKLSY